MGEALLGLGALGAALHIGGSVLIVYGQTLVKVAHCVVETGFASTWALPDKSQALWRRPDGKWRHQRAGSKTYAAAGWGMFGVGNLVRFVAMRFAAQTVLAGLGSLQFVVIPLASRTLLGIRPTGSTLLGVGIVLLGNVFIIAFGPAEVTFTLQQLRHQWTTGAMEAFLVVLGGLLCGLQLLWRHVTSSSSAAAIDQQRPTVAAAADATPSDQQHLLPSERSGSSLLREPDTLAVFTGAVLFSAVASFVGAWSVLFSKSLTYVVTALPASLLDWYSWFVVVAFLVTAAFWVRQSNHGLKLYPATLIMPLMQAFWMCMSVIEGGIYFNELAQLPSHHLGMLMLGLILALLGAVSMGIAGFVAEQPHRIFSYATAESADLEAQLAAAKGSAQLPASLQGPAVSSPRQELVSSPGGTRMVPLLVENGKQWRLVQPAVHRVHVFAAPVEPPMATGSARSSSTVNVPGSGGAASPRPPSLHPNRSPGQQLLSRENSSSTALLDGLFDSKPTGDGNLPGFVAAAADSKLLSGDGGSSFLQPSGKGILQRAKNV